MKLDNFHHFAYSDYWLHLYCYTQNILVDMSFGLLQEFYVELWSPPRTSVNRIETVYPCGLNKGFSSRFCVGSQVRHETPEENCGTYQLKHCEYNNKDGVNSSNVLSLNMIHKNSWSDDSISKKLTVTKCLWLVYSIQT